MGNGIIFIWMLGLLISFLVIAGAVRFLFAKRYIGAGLCIGIILIAVGLYVFYKYEENERLALNRPLDKPVPNSLVPSPRSIPKFLVQSLEFKNGFESRYEYVYPEDLGKTGRPPKLVVEFDNFNRFRSNCLDLHDQNKSIYRAVPAEMIKSPTGSEANFFVWNSETHPSMKISMDDQFGCLEIYAEDFTKDLVKKDLINIFNSMIRVE